MIQIKPCCYESRPARPSVPGYDLLLPTQGRHDPMPRYYFHVQDGSNHLDLQGTDLPGLEAARAEALRYSCSLLGEMPDRFWSGEEWTMRVTNEDDLILFSLLFMATNSPAGSVTDRGSRQSPSKTR